MNSENSDRTLTLDVLKGLLIIGIVFVHVFTLNGNATGSRGYSGILAQGLYILLMLFFIISGYVYKPNRGFLKNMRNRTKQLGVRIVLGLTILPLILWPYLAAFGNTVNIDDYLFCVERIIGSSFVFCPIESYGSIDLPAIFVYTGYYFIQIMLASFIMFYAIVDRVRENLWRTIVSITVLTAISFILMQYVGYCLPFWFELSPLATAFMIFGAYLGNRHVIENIEKTGFRNRNNWIVLTVTLVASVLMLYLFPTGTGFDIHYFGAYGYASVFPYFLAGCSCGMFALTLTAMIPRIPVIAPILSTAGRYSIGILCLHMFTFKLLIGPFHLFDTPHELPVLGTWEGILVGALSIVICIAISYALNKYLPIIFGNPRNKMPNTIDDKGK